jgi:phospholipid/cholesterol/gamma-HCH transport system permease protein
MATVEHSKPGAFSRLWETVIETVVAFGDFGIFGSRAMSWLIRRFPSSGTLLNSVYTVGVLSVPVVAITGAFIGAVLAVQTYGQFYQLGMATRLGAMINSSVVRELGPVLAATMLAGRVGGAMAAELATMRVTEQIDALDCLGANSVHYLVVPRFIACVLLIPVLTIIANFMGVMGGALVSIQVYHIDSYHYWKNAQGFIGLWDLFVGLLKPMFFGAAISLISCYRGFRSTGGAEGVGKAATDAFVYSFISILVLDFFLALGFNRLYDAIWPATGSKFLG